MPFGCVSFLLRASFLTLALPLLLLGSLLSEVSRQLHLQSVNHLRYAIGEETASTGLEALAEQSAAGAVEQQTEALEFETEAARLQQLSAESEQAAIEQREVDAGMEVDEGAEEAAAEGTEELSAAVDAAAEVATAGDAAASDAAATATAVAAGEAAEATASAAEAAEGATAAAEGAAAAAAEGATAAAAEGATAVAAEGSALAAGEAAAAEAGAVAGPVGIAVASAGVAAAVEAPKVVAAAQGFSAELQADKDEVLAVEREAQVGALETDSVVEGSGAGLAHDAAWSSVAAAGGYYVSGQLVQVAAFAFEAPIALVVLSQRILSALAPVFGTLCGFCAVSGSLPKCSDSQPQVSQRASVLATVTLTTAVGSLLLSPWAETVLYAAKLETEDPTVAAIASLPQLYQEALAKHQKNEVHQSLLKENKTFVLSSTEKGPLSGTRRLWPDWAAFGNAVKDDVNKTQHAAQGALQASEKTLQGAASAVAGVMPENVKKAASVAEKVGQEAATATGKAAVSAAEELKESAIRFKNGNPNVHTTTVAPREPEKAPILNHWSLMPKALSHVQQRVWSWILPVLRCVALASAVLAFTELGIALGRHYPAVKSGSAGQHVILGRVLHDMYAKWVLGLALLIALWVLSIILATSLRGLAEWVQLQQQKFAGLFLLVQLLLCLVCLAQCSSLAWQLSQLEECKDEARKISENGEIRPTDEERRLLEVEAGSQASTARTLESEPEKVPARSLLRMVSSMAASGICFTICGVLDALLLAMENPVSAWALGASWKSLFTVRFLANLLPWSLVAPSILGYKPSSPYELLAPVVVLAFAAGGLLVFARRKNI